MIPMMKRLRWGCTAIAVAALLSPAACSSTGSRIEENQEMFDSYSPDVQARLRAGKVSIGDSEDMVYMALGKPSETSVQQTEDGEKLVWGWVRSTPGIGIGVGGGGGSWSGGGGGAGISMGTGPRRDYTAIVEFRDGLVTSVRYFEN